MSWALLGAGLVLAFANGANDNPKGVATVYGAKRLGYPAALALATLSTAAGSLCSLALATGLVRAFSGKGLVPPDVLDAGFLTAVAAGAAVTVLLATRVGLPISTTHAIVGALVGAGAMLAGSALELSALGASFLVPLALGPVVALGLALALHRLGAGAGRRLGLDVDRCVCATAGAGSAAGASASDGGAIALRRAGPTVSLDVAHADDCVGRNALRVDVGSVLDGGHLLSATAVGFARGLNDTPKILGLLVGGAAVEPVLGAVAITVTMALGGLVAARRVADTLSYGITPIGRAPGLAGNLATSLLVIFASRLGLPVSTTHVAAGGIFGIGAADGRLRADVLARIVAAWLGTLPLAAALAALFAWSLGTAGLD